ncbi:MAG: glutamine--fructose-6-phosphate transaminase (isomerizing) [Bacillota bacterium]
MCGIVGYIGDKKAASILMEGLEHLEYRGYDSAGIALQANNKINVTKEVGKLDELKELLNFSEEEGLKGIGHTRWATHGRPSKINSHPHYDCNNEYAVVHNGIIENFQELKSELIEKGHDFKSETDTEVIAHLIEEKYTSNLKDAVREAVKVLDGSYALAVLSTKEPDKIIGVRKDSPLVIGKNNGENFIASDMTAFLSYTDQFYILDDGEMAEVTKDNISLFDLDGDNIEKDIFKVDWDAEMAEKNGYEHYMLKEINEQPDSIRRVLNNRISPAGINFSEIGFTKEEMVNFDKLYVVACGTAYHSGLVGEYLIEEMVNIPVEVEVASEFRYKEPILDENTLVVVVSQSGETADTLAALRLAKNKGAKVLAFVNVKGSTISREADEVIYLKAGPEIAVASTKAYVNMVTAFYLLTLYLGEIKGSIAKEKQNMMIKDILRLPELAREIIKKSEKLVKDKAKEFKNINSTFFIGRNVDYTLALEGALKLKEISYIHAEAYPAGELKHGTLALIEEGTPVIAIATRQNVLEKTLSNIEEVRARGGDILGLVLPNNEVDYEETMDQIIEIPDVDEMVSSILTIIPLQLLAYYAAVYRDCDIDQPRNLAKSVTVE